MDTLPYEVQTSSFPLAIELLELFAKADDQLMRFNELVDRDSMLVDYPHSLNQLAEMLPVLIG